MAIRTLSVGEMIQQYAVQTIQAAGLLYERNFYGHLLVVIYSSIDTLGLLGAPSSQTTASGQSFKNWVAKYLLSDPRIEFSDTDLWAARCAVLHTFTSESNLSKSGNAKELQYYSGDKQSEFAREFDSTTRTIQGGKNLPVNIDDFLLAFLDALQQFTVDLEASCKSDVACANRVRNILQLYPV